MSYYRLHHLKQEISFVIPGNETFGDESEQYVFSGRIEKKLEFLVEMYSKATEVENDADQNCFNLLSRASGDIGPSETANRTAEMV